MLTHKAVEDKLISNAGGSKVIAIDPAGRGAMAAGKGGFLTAPELAEWLHVSLRTIGNWQRRRVVPYLKVGRVVRFQREQVTAALAGLTLLPVIPRRRVRVDSTIPPKK